MEGGGGEGGASDRGQPVVPSRWQICHKPGQANKEKGAELAARQKKTMSGELYGVPKFEGPQDYRLRQRRSIHVGV